MQDPNITHDPKDCAEEILSEEEEDYYSEEEYRDMEETLYWDKVSRDQI